MPRIEQQPNGTYVKRTNTLEEQIIERLYKEINDRELEVSAMRIRVDGLDGLTAGMSANLETMDVRIKDMEETIAAVFGSGEESLIDKNLRVAGYIKASRMVLTNITGAPMEVYSSDMVDNLNVEFLGDKSADDFAPIGHVGSGGNAHSLATDIEDGFMSSEDFAKLREFEVASEYTLKTAFTAVKEDYESHKGVGGTVHKEATITEAGFLSPEDKTLIDSLPASFAEYVKKIGDQVSGSFTFTEDNTGLLWESKTNPGSDYAKIVYMADGAAAGTEDGTLLIEVGNDGNPGMGPDRIEIRTVTENASASEIAIRTVTKEGKTTGGRIKFETDTFEVTKDSKSDKVITNKMNFMGMDTHFFNLKSTGLDGASPSFNSGFWFDGQQILLDGTSIGYGRGYNVAAWHRTNQTFLWVRTYDTHATTANTNPVTELTRLTNDLNSLDSNYIVFIWAYDQPSFENRQAEGGAAFTQTQVDSVIAALQRCGSSGIIRNMPYRASYCLVGIPGIARGNGQEMYQYPGTVDLGSLIVGKHPIGMGFTSN